jgi:hypothetical protein
MELSPWEANIFSDHNEIPSILPNPEVHRSVHKSPPLEAPILNKINPVHSPADSVFCNPL